jgi:PAS domain S-box-containing protein
MKEPGHKNKPATSPDAAELRRRAEAKLAERKKRAAVLPATSPGHQRLVHELEVHQIELEMQNEELVQSRTQVEAGLRQYTDLYDFAPMGYFTLALDGAIRQVNLAGANLFGVERGALIKRRFGVFISVESLPIFNAFLENVFSTSGSKKTCEVALLKDESAPIWIYIEAITEDGKECRAVVSDITKRKQAEESISDSLKEKEVLLKEVNHRVKNNLMILIGLIKMQETEGINERSNNLLKELEGRIRSMAQVHQSLYSSESLSRVNLQDYIKTMSTSISAQFGMERDILFSVQASGAEVGPDIAISLGLILNELITNAYKHAFPENKNFSGAVRNEINVIACRDGDELILTVANNGVGLPADFELEKSESLGLQLVKMLIKQINGSIELDRSAGTAFRLKFSVADKIH